MSTVDLHSLGFPDEALAARTCLTRAASAMQPSQILDIAAEAIRLKAERPDLCNLTIGDFAPSEFPIPAELAAHLVEAVRTGQTNYPPPDGIFELKQAVAGFYGSELGLACDPTSICVCSGARPAIYAAWRLFVEPGDRTVSFVPAWNVSYYAQLSQSDHLAVTTRAENNFFPTPDEVARAIRGARLVMLNSPLNPTGTVVSREVLEGITRALVDENRRRGWDALKGTQGDEPPCIMIYDQVYWMLRARWVEHYNPVVLVPEAAPFVIHVDAISKCFAATGLRVGWAVVPPFLAESMRALVGHMGSWAPRPEQVATARFLQHPDAVRQYMAWMSEQVGTRLIRLYEGIKAMRARGLPVDAIPPQGAIHLAFRVDLIGRGFDTNEQIRRWLLHDAGLAVVPFQAFDLNEENGWLRMSVGTVTIDELDRALSRLEEAVARR